METIYVWTATRAIPSASLRDAVPRFCLVSARVPVYVSRMTQLQALEAHLRPLGRVLIGYSGGVDSAVLAVGARRALGRDNLLAVIGRSPSFPAEQHGVARRIAEQFDLPLEEIDTHELEDARYAANPLNRCYYCKHELWQRLGVVARERGFAAVLDGTNADDLGEHRPGFQAGRESGIRSPLAELGWRKDDVRRAARELGLPIWNAPAAPCLASRLRYGVEVTPERLRQVEEGEAFLRSLGISGDLRVRHLGGFARVEMLPAQFARARASWADVERIFAGLGFSRVELDPRGYRRGSLLPVRP